MDIEQESVYHHFVNKSYWSRSRNTITPLHGCGFMKHLIKMGLFYHHTSYLVQDVSFVSCKSNSMPLVGVQLSPLLLGDSPRLLCTQPCQLSGTEHHLGNTSIANNTGFCKRCICFLFICYSFMKIMDYFHS